MTDTVPKRCVRRLSVIAAALVSGPLATGVAVPAAAVPAPEVEYTYNVIVRRHFDFPYNDALGYGFSVCDKVSRGVTYRDVMAAVKAEIFPNDEQAANYVVSYSVGLLCPAQIAQLRQTAANDAAP
ncbi:DUF732 domain-containing protein [Mycobacterium sp. AMU20-3851]|uniref:DUF732 domain-containing protein n=1 Tax=Mycobacterium sp. AMU20-3851 TaxID=3122055 RepID=UPI00375456EF